jgi:Putative prokaryotic signal transducing protein
MKKLTSAPTLVTIHHYRNVLTAEGIASEIRNEFFGGILGDMPFTETWVQLWVVNDLDYERALQLIGDSALDESPSESWRCDKCGEENEGQFAACWSCGTAVS